MKVLNEQIKNKDFGQIYLICGPEDYLRKQYRDKMKTAMIGDDTMNYNYFEGKKIDVRELIDLSETLPFFAEHRLIIVENSGFFSSAQEELNNYFKDLPETTRFIFVEKDVDKRNRFYKTVASKGYVATMTAPDERTLIRWVAGLVRQERRYMSEGVIRYFLEKIDNNMDNIRRELEKLVIYTDGQAEIQKEDVDAVCTVFVENQIFEMIKCVADKKQVKALRLYYDLVELQEPPMRILYWIARQFNQLFQIKDLLVKGYLDRVIAERMGVRDFIVRKNKALCSNFTLTQLKRAVELCVEHDEAVKTGRLNDRMAVEMLIVGLSSVSK